MDYSTSQKCFLDGLHNETVFKEQPPGFTDGKLPKHVCHLERALYGLKRAPRAWSDRLSICFLGLGSLVVKPIHQYLF